MSKRNDIVENIVTVLSDADDPRFVFVSRAPIDPQQLANTQFPCAYAEALDETRQDESQKALSGQLRSATLQVQVVCFAKTSPEMMDIERNNIIERVEEALDADRTRGSNASNTQLINVAVENDVETTIGKITLSFEVFYTYRTGVA